MPQSGQNPFYTTLSAPQYGDQCLALWTPVQTLQVLLHGARGTVQHPPALSASQTTGRALAK